TRPAHSPSMGMRPSSVRPSPVKNSMAASMSSTTMPTLSIRLTVKMSPWRLASAFCRAALSTERRGKGVGQQRAARCHSLHPTHSPASHEKSARPLHFLFQPDLSRPGTTLHDLEIALDPIGPNLVRMRRVTTASEHSVLVERIIELGVVREEDGGAGGGSSRGYVPLRVDIGLKVLDARVRRVVHEIECGAA